MAGEIEEGRERKTGVMSVMKIDEAEGENYHKHSKQRSFEAGGRSLIYLLQLGIIREEKQRVGATLRG